MSTNEEKLSKLKVAELKELLAANHLVQSGKKDELVKRLVDNNVSVSSEGDAATAQEEELLDVADLDDAPAPAPAPTSESEPASASAPAAAPSTEATPSAPELTPEQLAMKKRAERFGVPFNPNPTPTARPPAASKATPAPASVPAAAAASGSSNGNGATASTTAKAGAIDKDKSSLGISDEKLAARAAKFGLPDKKPSAPASAGFGGAGPAAAPSAKALRTADAEISPEMAAKIAEEEEKRRKRAEKFGTGAGVKHAVDEAATSGEPDRELRRQDAKKAKV